MSVTVIEAGRAEKQYWHDLWRYRELFYFLAWRDLLVRYKQTVIGISWSLIRPVLTMLVLSIVFGRLGNMPSHGTPYPLLVFCGILPWQFFATALSESGNSLVSNSNLISKVYFPRIVVPVASVITSLVDLVISALFLGLLMIWYQHLPPVKALMLPLFVGVAFVAAMGIGLWVSALMVRFRDFRFIVPFAVQFGLYITPVGFSSTVVPPQWQLLYAMNPMVGVIDGFRWSLLGGQHALNSAAFAVSAGVAVLLVITGTWYFRRTERTFADLI